MKRGSLVAAFIGVLLLAHSSAGAPAMLPYKHQRVAEPSQNQPALSLDEAVRQVQRDTGGRILTAESVPAANGNAYRIKVLLPSGRVKVIYVDARR